MAETSIDSVDREGVFTTLFEPSGITVFDDQHYLIAEDEPEKALRLISFTPDMAGSEFQEKVITLGSGFIQRQLLGRLDDLEGAARGPDGRLYVIGSHDDAYKGKLSARQKLISFTADEQGTANPRSRHSIRASLRSRYPELAARFSQGKQQRHNALNIEALAFDRKRNRLLIGLRTPQIEGEAVIATLLNPKRYLEDDAEAVWAESLWTVDLEKGGLRALAYDDQTDALIAVSQRESGKSKRFKLWVIAADRLSAPRRVKSTKKDLFATVEGVSAIDSGILFVRDDGDRRKKQGASWFILGRQQLGIDTQ